MKHLISLLTFCCACNVASICFAADCGGGQIGSGLAANNTVLIVWAKTVDDASTFPGWANGIPTTLSNFYSVMSYNQHTITTKVATKNGGFFVSDAGHTVAYYKSIYQSGQGYVGPFAIFVEEMLQKVEAEYGAGYFDNVDAIIMLITDGSTGWYYSTGNYTGVGILGVSYTTGNGKTFGNNDGMNLEFGGEYDTKWNICHEYGHYIGLPDLPIKYGAYSLMQHYKVNETNEGAVPLGIKEIIDLNWINMSDPTRAKIVSSNTSVTLKPVRSTTGAIVAKINIPSTSQYFLVTNHQRSTNTYDGTYPADGLLIWHVNGALIDIECAAALNPTSYGFNFDHLDLSGPPNAHPDYHGEGLATDFHNPTNKKQFSPWTNPNTDRYGGTTYTGIAIDNISYNGTDITFDVNFNFNSGTISENSWWNGSETIGGDVTLNSGKTLTVTPNTTVSFASGARLTVNGSLVAESTNPAQRITLTRSGASGYWDGIYLNSGSSTNTSTLRRCNITYADDGIWITYTGNSNNVTIDKCRISDSGYEGILVNGDTYSGATVHPIISNNHIHDNTNGYGIFLMNYAKPLITGNRIENNYWGGIYASSSGSATVTFNYVTGSDDGSDFGMHFEGNSHAAVHRNTITANNGGGIYAGASSNLVAYGAGDNNGRNKITSNSGDGIYSVDSSPIFGKDVSNQWGNNHLQDHGGYQARQIGTGQLRAERCYWGGQHADISGNVDNVPYLSTAPSPVGWGQSDGHDPSLLMRPKSDDQSWIASVSKTGEVQAKFDPIEWSAKYGAAMKAGLQLGDWSDAAEVITQLWRELQDARIPVVDFSVLADDVQNSKVESFIRKYLALVLVEKSLAVRDVSQALADLEKYRQSNTECDTELLANTGTIKLMFLKNVAATEEVLAELQRRASENDSSAVAHTRSLTILLDKYRRNPNGTNLRRATSYSASLGAKNKTNLQMGNYPNPFNPETLIRFYLPDRKNVRLSIYDVSGRLIQTLVDGELPAGEQTLLWNGHNEHGRPVASGIYFYELRLGNKVERKRMTLVR